MHCPLCASLQVRKKHAIGSGHAIYRCSRCQLEFLFPQLTDEDLKTLYAEDYYASWGLQGNKENESTRQMKLDTFHLRWKLIKQFCKTGKVLDVGCATGYFLELAQQEGFEAFGVEFSEYAAQKARQKFGTDNIFNGTLEQCEFTSNFFDVIAMSDLLEHVRDPASTILKAATLLKDNGVIMIMT